METPTVRTHQAVVDFGLGTTDITPPVGIYHRTWGAAAHDRAAGVHRPLRAEVLAIGPSGGGPLHLVRVQTDLVGLVIAHHERLTRQVADAAGVDLTRVVLGYSHTHSSGWF